MRSWRGNCSSAISRRSRPKCNILPSLRLEPQYEALCEPCLRPMFLSVENTSEMSKTEKPGVRCQEHFSSVRSFGRRQRSVFGAHIGLHVCVYRATTLFCRWGGGRGRRYAARWRRKPAATRAIGRRWGKSIQDSKFKIQDSRVGGNPFKIQNSRFKIK